MNTIIFVCFALVTVATFVYGLTKSNVAKVTVTKAKNLMAILTLKSPADPFSNDDLK